MRIIDITKPIEDKRKYYPTLPPPTINFLRHYSLGHDHWVSSITLPVHTATHVDTPAHFFSDGKTIDEFSIREFISFAQVIDCSDEQVITKDHLIKAGIKAPALLFKTKTDPENYTYFDLEAAVFLVENNVKIVGTEAQSVDKFGDKSYKIHKTLMKHGIIIVEGLNLKEAKEKIYLFMCFPILIKNVEGSPARAILIEI